RGPGAVARGGAGGRARRGPPHRRGRVRRRARRAPPRRRAPRFTDRPGVRRVGAGAYRRRRGAARHARDVPRLRQLRDDHRGAAGRPPQHRHLAVAADPAGARRRPQRPRRQAGVPTRLPCFEGGVRMTARSQGNVVSLDQDWLFGGEYVDGAETPDHDDRDFVRVTLPHTVTELSWRDWDPASWEQVWIYRRHFDLPADLAGNRPFVDFGAALSGATVTLNGHELGEHLGGYLPFSFEIVDTVRSRGNVLAVRLDSRFT